MTVLWVVCGAARGVGKTHLATSLCGVLPDAVYVKSGHGRPRPGKPANFFQTDEELSAFIEDRRGGREHIVAESNALARRRAGDVIIFVDAAPGCEDVRPDAAELRANSHIVISPAGSTDGWRDVLAGRLDDPELCDSVFDALLQQQEHVRRPVPAVRSKVWFVAGGKRVFGSGLAQLLVQIDRLGTIRQAAEAVKMSYRFAWGLLKAAEKGLGKRLIRPRLGGVGGGGAELSPEGRRLLGIYERLSSEVAAFADDRFAQAWNRGTAHENP